MSQSFDSRLSFREMFDLPSVSLVESTVSEILSDLYLWLATIMIGDFVIMGKNHNGKLRDDNEWAGFWSLIGYLLFSVLVSVVVSFVASPFIADFLLMNFAYVVGITTGILGTFFVWFVYSFDYDITTQWKWAFPLISYLVTAINVAGLHYF